jgi:hypothetical protein
MLPHLVVHSLDAYGDPLRLRMMVTELESAGNAINPQMLGPLYRHATDFRHWYAAVEPPMILSDDGDARVGFRIISVLVPLFDLAQILSMKFPELDWYLWYTASSLGFKGFAVYRAGEQVEKGAEEIDAVPIPPETIENLKAMGFAETT